MARTLVVVLGCLLSIHPDALGFQMSPQELLAKLDTPEFARVLDDVLGTVKIGIAPQTNPKTGAKWGPPVPVVFLGAAPIGVPRAKAPDRLTLPAAGFCSMMQPLYQCEWETKPNKSSAAVLEDEISARVAAALPNAWKREKGQDDVRRYVDFIDPTGEIAITVSCPVSKDHDVLTGDAFTARLTIHRSELRYH